MILKICAVALIGAILSFVFKCYSFKGAPLISVAAIIALLLSIGSYLSPVVDFFDTVRGVDGTEEAVKTLLKILGLGYVCGIVADVCREMGENAIANTLGLLFRLEMLVLILPMINELLSVGLELIG